MKPFDLNMEEVLENWEPFHAIREIFANALDEQLMSQTAEIVIEESKDGCGYPLMWAPEFSCSGNYLII